jgi:hypothetical protein
MPLRGQSVLFVDGEISIFVLQLELATEQAAGECPVAPDMDSALRRTEQFNFKAGLLYVEDCAMVDQLRIPLAHCFVDSFGRAASSSF